MAIIKMRMRCSKCNHINLFPVFENLELNENDKIRPNLLKGNLFRLKCKYCGARTPMDYELLCFDKQTRSYIWANGGSQENATKIIERMDNLTLKKVTCRQVDDLEHLAEKLRIFNDGYDDRAIEGIKSSLAYKMTGDALANVSCLYLRSENGALIFTAENNSIIAYPLIAYEEMKKMTSDEDHFGDYKIDAIWLANTLGLE